MTRFMMTLSEAVKLVLLAFEDMIGGEIYVKNKSMRVVDSTGCCKRNAARDYWYTARRKTP